jgi:hypothetical protein
LRASDLPQPVVREKQVKPERLGTMLQKQHLPDGNFTLPLADWLEIDIS